MDIVYAETRPPSEYYAPPPITRRLHTPAGLKYASYGLLLLLIMSLVAFIAFLPLAGVADPTTISPAAMAAVVGLACLVSVLVLVSIIFFILAIYEFYVGKTEFGPKHASRVTAGVILAILWIVLSVLSISVVFFAAMAAYDPTATDPSQIEMEAGEFRNLMIISSVLGIAGTVAWSLAGVFFALELISPEKKMLLWGGLGLRVAAPIIGIVILMLVLPVSGTVNLNEADVQTGYSNATAIIDLIGVALFFVAYRAAREGILTGKVMPVGMPPAQPPPSGPPPQWGQQWPPSQTEEPPKWEEPDTTSEEEVIRPS